MQSSPQEESYDKESVDPVNSLDGGGLGGNLGKTFGDTAIDPDKMVKGDAIEKQVDHHHGVEQQDGGGAEEHHRHKRQARVDWTLRRSTVSKIYLLTCVPPQ